MNEPIGRRGEETPAWDRRIAEQIFSTASSWPITRLWISASMWSNFFDFCSARCIRGIPVACDTTRRISSSSTFSCSLLYACSHAIRADSRRDLKERTLSLTTAACSKSWAFTRTFFSSIRLLISASMLAISGGSSLSLYSSFRIAPASSRMSIALSGM